jgi:hypothetical protein
MRQVLWISIVLGSRLDLSSAKGYSFVNQHSEREVRQKQLCPRQGYVG